MLSLELEHFLAPSARARRLEKEVHGISRILRAAAGDFSPRKLQQLGTEITFIGTRERWRKLNGCGINENLSCRFPNLYSLRKQS